jgi:hypothetical protein
MGSTTSVGLGSIFRCTSVHVEEAVSQSPSTINRKYRIGYSMNTKISNGSVAAVATAQFRTGNRSNGAEDIL